MHGIIPPLRHVINNDQFYGLTITILDIIHRLLFKTAFRRQSSLRKAVFNMKDKTMDDVQDCDKL
jgi:hypothetical protein